MVALPWILLFSPLLACVAIVLGARKSKPASTALAIGGLAVSFVCALQALTHAGGEHPQLIQSSLNWINLPGLLIEFGLLLDKPAILMSLVVTGVGLMVFTYSTAYMKEDRSYTRYFACLSLFAFSMLGIVLSNNFVSLFIFWELVGASSYLLIGYWYEKPSAAAAGKKAFLVNRIADFGFLLGILTLWNISGLGGHEKTLNFVELAERIPQFVHAGLISSATLSVAALLVFCGVLGKSAQFPLHVWLPDAMEGPTPVSALIHAATMVAAGVYLIARTYFLFWEAPQALIMVAWIGGFTSLFAASMALVENDIKRILAFSTLSQLGYMVMALGLGGYTAGIYHLTTHAFFKALLFLGAGSAIHAVHSNDIWKMGGLLKKMPITGWTFLLATLALCGIFPLSGFWSKDEILAVAFQQNKILYLVGTLTAGLTAFYMGRLFSIAFLNPSPSKGEDKGEGHGIHESPWAMTIPLMLLTIPTIFGGFMGFPEFLHHTTHGGIHVEFNMTVAIISSIAAIAGLALAFLIYSKGMQPSAAAQKKLTWLATPLTRKYWIDEIYRYLNQNVQQQGAIFLGLFEKYVIMGLFANGMAKITGVTGLALRRIQTGRVQSYAFMVWIGFAAIFLWVFRWVR